MLLHLSPVATYHSVYASSFDWSGYLCRAVKLFILVVNNAVLLGHQDLMLHASPTGVFSIRHQSVSSSCPGWSSTSVESLG